ncbi:ribose ABC transport system, periplasmic ribose-binding protein RbsB [Aquitalea magnusonii]|uniref:Ribose ABC transport system, periplasmic ribose-binding protein RbsB n=1 Tax=Aquitalea magnusonii TaxID=332411 RepID=A0A3G9GGT2_9NEIS|nr:substrate-binding domain-containing protein [Aquitalea magnusonii]BBF85302.1 ribose ABC transport system, periplasmic ribose-binding protein RbsB [Aquitalea magnusonii]
MSKSMGQGWRGWLTVALLSVCALVQARECLSFIYASGGRDYWANLQTNVAREGERLGYFIYDRGVVDSEHLIDDAQIELLNVAVARRCRAIILAPSATIANYNEILRFLPVPVVLIDRNPGLTSQYGSVASDNVAIGALAWKRMKKHNPAIRQVLVLPNSGRVPSTEQRLHGFIAAARKDGASVLYGPPIDQAIGRGRQTVKAFIQGGSATFDAIFTPNESSTTATILALRQLHLAGRYDFVGVDRNPLIADAVRNGEMLATMVQDGEKMARLAVELADAAIKTPGKPGRNILLPPFVLDRQALRNAR